MWAAVSLARHPDQRRILVDDPRSSRTASRRRCASRRRRPCTPGGSTATSSSTATVVERLEDILLNGSADRDERHFANPDVFDVRRHIDRHVAFGYGAHFCVGAALARLESRSRCEETLKRFPTWEIDESRLEWVHTSTVRGFANVPMRVR